MFSSSLILVQPLFEFQEHAVQTARKSNYPEISMALLKIPRENRDDVLIHNSHIISSFGGIQTMQLKHA
jgi:hypothetical protein